MQAKKLEWNYWAPDGNGHADDQNSKIPHFDESDVGNKRGNDIN